MEHGLNGLPKIPPPFVGFCFGFGNLRLLRTGPVFFGFLGGFRIIHLSFVKSLTTTTALLAVAFGFTENSTLLGWIDDASIAFRRARIAFYFSATAPLRLSVTLTILCFSCALS